MRQSFNAKELTNVRGGMHNNDFENEFDQERVNKSKNIPFYF